MPPGFSAEGATCSVVARTKSGYACPIRSEWDAHHLPQLAGLQKLRVEKLVEPIKGLFADTLPVNRERIGSIALLHMDGDWYSSTRDILENLFDVIPLDPGHVVRLRSAR